MPWASSQRSNGGTTTVRLERRGRDMMPMFCNDSAGCILNAILLHRFFACVQKILLIAFRARPLAAFFSQTHEARQFRGLANDGNRLLVQRRVVNYATRPNL